MCSQWSLNVLPEMIQRKGQLTSVWLKAASPEAGEHATDDAPEGTQAVVRRSDSDTPFLQISQIVPLRHFFVQKKFVCLVIFCRDLSFLCGPVLAVCPTHCRWRYGLVGGGMGRFGGLPPGAMLRAGLELALLAVR